MKRIIIYFLIILGSIWLGVKIVQHPGYVLLAYKDWVIESTTWFLLLCVLGVFLIFHLLLNLIKQAFFLPRCLENWMRQRKLHKSIKLIQRGYCELILGRWHQAEKRFLKSAKKGPLAFIDYILAAEAAEGKSNDAKRDLYLLKAEGLDKKNAFVVSALRAEMLLNNHQPEEAQTLIAELRKQKPREPYLIRLQTESYLMLGEYLQLQKLLPEIKKAKIFDDKVYSEIEKNAYLHGLQDQNFSDFSQVQSQWNKMPRTLRHDPDVLIAYSEHLNRWNRGDQVEDLIRKQLKSTYSHTLMEYYATLKSKQPAKQVELGKKWLKEHSDDPATLTAMGMLCLRNRLWGQARDYFEAAQKIQPLSENYSVLGYIYEKLGESDRALHYYRKGLKTMH